MTPRIKEILIGRWLATNKQGQKQHFDNRDEAVTFSNTGSMIEHRGFEIHPATFAVFRNGKPMDGSYWKHNVSIDAAKISIDAALITRELKASPALVLHEIEDDRFGRWMENEHENQLHQFEK